MLSCGAIYNDDSGIGNSPKGSFELNFSFGYARIVPSSRLGTLIHLFPLHLFDGMLLFIFLGEGVHCRRTFREKEERMFLAFILFISLFGGVAEISVTVQR